MTETTPELTATERTILARRSIRKFTEQPVPPELVTRLLEAAMAGPSASNKRPWEFVVVDDPELLSRVRRGLPFGKQNAPLAIIVCANMRRTYPPPARDFWVQDCAVAAENILLAATSLGLGAVWIGVHPVPPFRAGVARALGLPKRVVPLGLLNVGYPAEERPPRTQYDPALVHWNGYGKDVLPEKESN